MFFGWWGLGFLRRAVPPQLEFGMEKNNSLAPALCSATPNAFPPHSGSSAERVRVFGMACVPQVFFGWWGSGFLRRAVPAQVFDQYCRLTIFNIRQN